MNNLQILAGKKCTLQPLKNEHYTALAAIVLKHPEQYQLTTLGHNKEQFNHWFEKALSDNALVIIEKTTDKIIGSSRYYETNSDLGQTKIGYTWLSPESIGTGINTEIKYLMLSEVFERQAFIRVGFDIDSANSRSRRAVEKLGATLEGELRLHRRRSDGSIGHTCCYSIVEAEWHTVKANLIHQMKRSL